MQIKPRAYMTRWRIIENRLRGFVSAHDSRPELVSEHRMATTSPIVELHYDNEDRIVAVETVNTYYDLGPRK